MAQFVAGRSTLIQSQLCMVKVAYHEKFGLIDRYWAEYFSTISTTIKCRATSNP